VTEDWSTDVMSWQRYGDLYRYADEAEALVVLFRAPGEKFRFARGPGECGIAGPPASMAKTYRIRNKSYGKKRIGTRESACDYRVNNNKKIWENQVTACFGIIFG